MLSLIKGDVEVLHRDPETQMYPICDDAGFPIGAGESYLHAMEIKKALGSHNKILNLLLRTKKFLMSQKGKKAQKIQKQISNILVAC
jgi:hypothetical protein